MALENRHLVFAKNCSNAHGTFAKGDVARGAFSEQLVADYLAVGILVEREAPGDAAEAEFGIAEQATEAGAEADAEADQAPASTTKSRKR